MKRKDKGVVLIVLIVGFLIVSVLAGSSIHYSYVGLKIAQTYAAHSAKAYKGDEVLDIIRAGVQDECTDILKKQYDRMLDSYSFTPSSQRNLVFKDYYTEAMTEAFIADDVDLREKFCDYVSNSDASIELKDAPNEGGIYIHDDAQVVYDDESMYMTIQNIRVDFSLPDGSAATVGCDLVIETPMVFEDSEGGFTFESEYQDYVLIADDSITYNVSATTNIHGSIYAGDGGIEVGKTASPTVRINGNYVNTRGNLFVSNGSYFRVRNKREGSMCDIYAKNIMVDSIYSGSTTPATVDLEGNIYVEDDLEVNVENATVKLGGSYVGYGMEETDYSVNGNLVDKDDNTSSAVIMNKTNSTLDLTTLEKMILAGSSYITPSKDGTLNKSIVTDESLTAKFMQIAYMVPSVCISTHTNPVQYDGVMNITIDYSKSAQNGGIDLEDARYSIMDNPILLTVPGRNGTTLQYYFLRFSTREGQSKYIEDYFDYNYDYINAKAGSSLEAGRVLQGDTLAYISKGNMLTYDYNSRGQLALSLTNGIASDDFIQSEHDRAVLKAVSLNSALAYNQTDTLTDSLFETIINEDHISNAYNYDYYTLDDIDGVSMSPARKSTIKGLKEAGLIPYDCIVYTKTDAYTIPAGMTRGVVIAYGDVNVNHDFIGCIISKGKINITAGVDLYSDNDETDQYPLLTLLINYADAETIQGYFRNFAGFGGGTHKSESLDIRNLVRLTNYVTY